ncbi:MAG: hypothetical protein VB979_08380 [Acinetobacter sp.]|uniref:hypothetical protein n=1 Tax=Acinetobacter sp. TaxID=472 RepID=UPI0039824565
MENPQAKNPEEEHSPAQNPEEANFWQKIFLPFTVISDCKTEFFIWALFTLLAGQLGILTNIIIRIFGTDKSFLESLYLDSQAGNFYIYAIAIVASMLGGVFTTFLSSKEASFRHIRIIACSILVLFLVFIAIIYSATQLKISNEATQVIKELKYTFDWWQFLIYLFSVVIAIYCFCIIKLHLPKFKILSSVEDYSVQETQTVDELSRNATQINNDGDLRV